MDKKWTIAALSGILLLGATIATAGAPEGWELVWSDEFDGPSIDTNKWTHEVNGWGGGNNELQYYTDRSVNSRIESGHLVIEARKENYTGTDGTRGYTSARLNSRFKGDWLYGRFEIRAKLPSGQGLWPAIWMLPTDWEYGGWAASGEIDIMEYRGDLPTTLYSTIHHGGSWPNNVHTGTTTIVDNLSEDFHTFALEWERNQIRWYCDGTEVYRQSDWWSESGPYPAPFDKRFHMLLNVAVGGGFLPDPPANADYFPQRMEVDYVRVYRRSGDPQEPFFANPHPVPGIIQAEDFDKGGEGFAYHDTTAENIGGEYRTDESPDIGSSFDGDGTPSIGWFGEGEWLEYTIEVATAGTYEISVRHAMDLDSSQLTFSLMDGDTATDSITNTFTGTGGWTDWATASAGTISLPSGTHVLRMTVPADAINVNFIEAELIEALQVDQWVFF